MFPFRAPDRSSKTSSVTSGQAYGRATVIGLRRLWELGAMFRIEWLIGAAAAARNGQQLLVVEANHFFL